MNLEGACTTIPCSIEKSVAAIVDRFVAASPVISRFEYLIDVARRVSRELSEAGVEKLVAELSRISHEACEAAKYTYEQICHPDALTERSAISAQTLEEGVFPALSEFFSYMEAFHVAKALHQLEVMSECQLAELESWVEKLGEGSDQSNCKISFPYKGHPKIDEISSIRGHPNYFFSIVKIEGTIRYQAEVFTAPRAGDVLLLRERRVLFLTDPEVSVTDSGQRILTGKAVSVAYDRPHELLEEDAAVAIRQSYMFERGESSWLLPLRCPSDAASPYRPGLLLQKGILNYNSTTDDEFYPINGQILRIQDGKALVLWKDSDGAPELEEVPFNSRGLLRYPISPDNFDAAQVLSLPIEGVSVYSSKKNRFLPILPHIPLQARRERSMRAPEQREYSARDIRAVCDGLNRARYPLLIRTLGMDCFPDLMRQLEHDTIQGLQSSVITRDTETLLTYGVCPTFVIASSNPHMHLLGSIRVLVEFGWRVVIWNNEVNQGDLILQDTIRSLSDDDKQNIAVVSGSSEDLLHSLRAIGKTHENTLTKPVHRAHYPRPVIRKPLSYITQQLFEISDAQLSEQTPTKLRISTELLSLCRAASLAGPQDQGALLETALRYQDGLDYAGVRGRTRLESELTGYDFIEISNALARSRLPMTHPAVALRGVTCGDLSPHALMREYVDGANFYTVKGPDGTIDGVAITYTPSVLELKRPGLSTLLGAPNKTGYLYWMNVNPDREMYSDRVYSKLISAFLLEQVVHGADVASAVVLERNIPSLTAAFAVAGFTITNHTLEVNGERMVRVVCDLRELEAGHVKKSYREAQALAQRIFGGIEGGDREVGRRRIQETLEYIKKLEVLLDSWERVKHVLSTTERFSPLDRATTLLFNAIGRLGDSIDLPVRSECALCLTELFHEEGRDTTVARLEELLQLVVPESRRELARVRRNLHEYAPESAHLEAGDERVADLPLFLEQEYPLISRIHAPEATSLDEITELNRQLSHDYREAVMNTRSGFDRYRGALSLHARGLNSQMESYRFARRIIREMVDERGPLLPDHSRFICGIDLSEPDRRHAEILQSYLSFVNEHLIADTFSQAVSTVAIPILEGLMNREC